MRHPIIIGNWKMNLSIAEGLACVEGFVHHLNHLSGVDVGIAPSFLALKTISEHFHKTQLMVGAQDVFWSKSGAFTGEVSVGQIRDAGAKFCIVGHSERRGRFGKLEIPDSTLSYFGESNETIGLKIRALIDEGMLPVLCVGENLPEREAGRTDQVIADQLSGALSIFDAVELQSLVIAYEPVWAIGTGATCDAQEANRVIGNIRDHVAQFLSTEIAEAIRIQYGGSVKASNSAEIFAQPEIDGALVGGSSLIASEFLNILNSTRPAHV